MYGAMIWYVQWLYLLPCVPEDHKLYSLHVDVLCLHKTKKVCMVAAVIDIWLSTKMLIGTR